MRLMSISKVWSRRGGETGPTPGTPRKPYGPLRWDQFVPRGVCHRGACHVGAGEGAHPLPSHPPHPWCEERSPCNAQDRVRFGDCSTVFAWRDGCARVCVRATVDVETGIAYQAGAMLRHCRFDWGIL